MFDDITILFENHNDCEIDYVYLDELLIRRFTPYWLHFVPQKTLDAIDDYSNYVKVFRNGTIDEIREHLDIVSIPYHYPIGMRVYYSPNGEYSGSIIDPLDIFGENCDLFDRSLLLSQVGHFDNIQNPMEHFGFTVGGSIFETAIKSRFYVRPRGRKIGISVKNNRILYLGSKDCRLYNGIFSSSRCSSKVRVENNKFIILPRGCDYGSDSNLMITYAEHSSHGELLMYRNMDNDDYTFYSYKGRTEYKSDQFITRALFRNDRILRTESEIDIFTKLTLGRTIRGKNFRFVSNNHVHMSPLEIFLSLEQCFDLFPDLKRVYRFIGGSDGHEFVAEKNDHGEFRVVRNNHKFFVSIDGNKRVNINGISHPILQFGNRYHIGDTKYDMSGKEIVPIAGIEEWKSDYSFTRGMYTYVFSPLYHGEIRHRIENTNQSMTQITALEKFVKKRCHIMIEKTGRLQSIYDRQTYPYTFSVFDNDILIEKGLMQRNFRIQAFLVYRTTIKEYKQGFLRSERPNPYPNQSIEETFNYLINGEFKNRLPKEIEKIDVLKNYRSRMCTEARIKNFSDYQLRNAATRKRKRDSIHFPLKRRKLN